jgi:glucokinase
MSIAKVLAGDIGGTTTRLGLYDATPARPRALVVSEFATLDFPDLVAMISAFAADSRVDGVTVDVACFGVAGPVIGRSARLTNVPWEVDASDVARAFDIPRVALLNDLQAMAYAVPALHGDELHSLQDGEPLRGGNIALIAAGTGLGAALLHNIDGRFVPSATESGHADWAARTERDIALLRDLVRRFGRAEVEHVVSGRGLVNIHRVTHADSTCPAVSDEDDPEAPAAISRAALERRCAGCVEALSLFVDAYGAEAGNMALRTVSTGGLFVGGGIAPKILPALTDGRFMRAFRDKAPFTDLLTSMPVKIILNANAGLLGAAVFASSENK